MFLKKITYEIKAATIKGAPFLVFVYIFFICQMVYLNIYGATDYASFYTSDLFIAFALSCIACKDMGLKVIRFDFQFRMTFVYLTLLFISWMTIMSSSLINNYITEFKELLSSFLF